MWVLILAGGAVPWTSAKASEYEEVSYEDLVRKLNSRTGRTSAPVSHPFDDIQVHTGFGFISSMSEVQYQNSSSTRPHYGFQISLGVDLFSSYWAAETSLRNFSPSNQDSESRQLRETDVRVIYKDRGGSGFGYRLGFGLGTRELRINDPLKNISFGENTPIGIGLVGLDQRINRNFSIGLDMGIRPSLVSRSADKIAMDLTLVMAAAF